MNINNSKKVIHTPKTNTNHTADAAPLELQESADIHTVHKRISGPLMIRRHDFEAFKEMVAETPMAEIIDTREKFEALVESHSLRQEGKQDEARGVLRSAGLKPFRVLRQSRKAYTY